MKVAFIKQEFSMGGVEAVLHYTSLALKQHNFEFYAICIGENGYGGFHLWDKSKLIKVIKLPEIKNGIDAKALIEIIKKEQIDLVCYPYRMDDLIHKIHRDTNAKTMYWYHTSLLAGKLILQSFWEKRLDKYYIFKYIPFINKLISILVNKRWKEIVFSDQIHLLKESDFTAVLSDNDRLEFIKYLKLNKELANKINVLINPIEINPSPKLNKEKRIVFMGRFEFKSKRIDRLIKIWELIYKDLPNWRLELYGDGECFEDIMMQIKKAKLERIYLMGRTDNPNEVYDKAAIVALTSQYEGFPMTLVEAQNNGCVPIAFASVGGIKAIIGEESTAGVLVKPFNIKEYAKKLKNLCLNENYRKELQNNALIKRYEYTMDKNIPIWLEIKNACGK